jgi:SAM-dependent methyltransferase
MAPRRTRKRKPPPDRHVLYTAAVQSLDADLDFARKAYRHHAGREPFLLREDFCGTAALACEWARKRKDRKAWGIDLDAETLDWGRRHYLDHLGPAADRVQLIQGDVLSVKTPPSDVVLALNFSYCIFKSRDLLKQYFQSVFKALKPGGVMVMDIFGGSGALEHNVEERDVETDDFDGNPIPEFEFIWEQARYNVVTAEILCHIHFKVPGFKRMNKVFTYDWRLWTIPELKDLLAEVGFSSTVVYGHGWDEDDESDGIYRRRTFMDNEEGWLAYVVGGK